MNCKPNSLVYIAKLIPWTSYIGERGEIDLRGTVFRIGQLKPGSACIWLIDGPSMIVPIFHWKPRPRVETLEVFGVADEYLKPFNDDPDPAESIPTGKEVTA